MNINEIPDSLYLNLLDDINFKPIFIIGLHRSGTTLLHKVLAETRCFNYVNYYHAIKYDELLYNHINKKDNQVCQELKEFFNSQGIITRAYDNVKVTVDTPVEYQSLIGNRFSKARYGQTEFEIYLNSENLQKFIEVCKKIQCISKADCPILLKNPSEFANFKFLKSAFPGAKFIFIHREPIPVINSWLKMQRSAWSKKSNSLAIRWPLYNQTFENFLLRSYRWILESEYFDLGVHRAMKRHVEKTTYFLQNIDSLQNQDYVSVRYEDFCKQPEVTILKILGFIGLKARATLDYEKLIEPRPLDLLPEVERNSEQIKKLLQPYRTYCGYET